MDIQQPPRNLGDKVFVKMGHLSAKHGAIAGARVTAVGGQKTHDIEYLVSWFGDGDRPSKEEWFPARQIVDTADAAFK